MVEARQLKRKMARKARPNNITRNREIFLGTKSWQARRSLLSQKEEIPGKAPPKFCSNAITTSKYTWWNFLPKNLFEQFRRVGNVFFLIVAVIQLALPALGDRSPVSPYPSVFAFLVVIVIAALKQAGEDILRHKEDKKVNNAPCTVIRDGVETVIKSREVTAGDLVKISEDENVPCDLVLLGSSNEGGHCFVTTANLDGETNLKKLKCVSPILLDLLNDPPSLNEREGLIECEHPHPDLYKFHGRLCTIRDGRRMVFPLNSVNFIIGGSTLKETTSAYAYAVYTGPQTKLGLNFKNKASKFSTAEKSMNRIVITILVLLVIEISILTTIHYHVDDYPIQRGLGQGETDRQWTDFLSFLILLNFMLPVSLYVSIEVQKFMGATFFVYDVDMYDAHEKLWPKCNTSDISEELGQINYLFSDKTGTLTENVMIMRSLCVGENCYHITNSGESMIDVSGEYVETLHPALKRLFVNLLLNHTVHLDIKNGVHYFKASSPDEKAFLEAAYHLGVKYEGVNKEEETVINFKGTVCKYKILNVLDFDAHRKCMSVIVRDIEYGVIYVLTKGAESSLEKSMVDDVQKQHAYRFVEEFAASGLRTLVFGERKIDESTYANLCEKIEEACCDIQDRETKLSLIYPMVEKDLHCIGATGVEDVLQEGVQDTLSSLHRAGIHIWVLTGDKKSTAMNISFACGHFQQGMELHEFTEMAELDELDLKFGAVTDSLEIKTHSHALVVDGKTLALIMKERKLVFANISLHCATVLCCRMSPLQKSEIIAMVKGYKERPICAAVGDGANDVSMIQEAHVGIAIMGKEGRQATLCSDFALAKFRFLKKAILVHGHWYYYRMSIFILYSMYKSFVLVRPQVYYSYFTMYSGTSLFQSVYLTLFNTAFTAIPIIAFGVQEQNYPKEVLLTEPELYRDLTKNKYMSAGVFFSWLLMGFYHSLVAFYMAYGMIASTALNEEGTVVFSDMDFGMLIFTIILVTVHLTLFYITMYWTVIIHLLYWGFLCFYFGFSLVFSYFIHSNVFMTFLQIFSQVMPWLCFMVAVVLSLIPVVVILVFYNHRQSHSRWMTRRLALESQQKSVVQVNESNVSRDIVTADSLSDTPSEKVGSQSS